MQEPFKVCIRVKPQEGRNRFTTQRVSRESLISVECPSQSLISPDSIEQRTFAFDNVFNEGESTQFIYETQIQQMVLDCVSQGYNGTILAYGQTGSGKSYTMFGNLYDSTIMSGGIVTLVLEQLFQMDVKICISYLEIYNEQIRDLIGDSVGLNLNEDPIKGVMVQDVVEVQVNSIEGTQQLIQSGNQKRMMAATNANQASSRSHAIIQLFVSNQQYQCKLSLVDLAGSEKGSVNEGGKGIRQIEGGNINKSLLALGNCINMLACDPQMKKFVPYRDSKLTRLLKDSLGGNTKTIMIGCIQQGVTCHEETINTLKYASRARAIKKKITQNIKQVEQNSETVNLLQQEIQNLKLELQNYAQLSEEEVELRMNLKQIDQLQQANQEGLQILLSQGDKDSKLEQQIFEFEQAIEENERIRQDLLSQYNQRKKERQDQKDQQIEILKKEIIFLKEQLKQKDKLIEQLSNKSTQASRPNTSYQDTDRIKHFDFDEHRKDSLQYCNSTNSIRQTTSREEEQQQQELIQLSKARETFKLFRTKMIHLREKIQQYLQNGTQLNQEQLKEIIDAMNELAQHKFKVSPQDQDLLIQFQQLMNQLKLQQTNSQQQQQSSSNRSRSLAPGCIRSKGSSQHNRKPLQIHNQSPMLRLNKQQQQQQGRIKKDCPTPSQGKRYIMDYVKRQEQLTNKSPLHSFSSENSDKQELTQYKRDNLVKRSYPFQTIQT